MLRVSSSSPPQSVAAAIGKSINESHKYPVVRAIGHGAVGQAVKENRVIHVREVPGEYLPVHSGLGAGTPRELLVAPASVDGTVPPSLVSPCARGAGSPRISGFGMAVRPGPHRSVPQVFGTSPSRSPT